MPLPKFLWETLGVSEHDRSFQASIGRIDSWFSPLTQLPRPHERRLAFEIRQMLDPIQRPGPELASNEQQAEIERLCSQNATLKSQLHTQSAWIDNLSKGIFSSSRF